MAALSQPVQYVSPEVAAQILRVNINSLYRAIRSKEVPHIVLGREYRIPVGFLGVTPEPTWQRLPDQWAAQLELPLSW